MSHLYPLINKAKKKSNQVSYLVSINLIFPIKTWIGDTQLKTIALKPLNQMPALLLQKHFKFSRNYRNSEYDSTSINLMECLTSPQMQ